MIHARPDYDPIQDPRGKIPKKEPVFLLRAQDELACQAVDRYVELCKAHQAPEVAAVAEAHAAHMHAWPVKKIPDLPPGITAPVQAPPHQVLVDALNRIARHNNSEWPQECQDMVTLAREAMWKFNGMHLKKDLDLRNGSHPSPPGYCSWILCDGTKPDIAKGTPVSVLWRKEQTIQTFLHGMHVVGTSNWWEVAEAYCISSGT